MGLSIRAYAEHRGVSDTAVRKAIKQGRISVLKNGKIDPEVADREWENNSNPAYQYANEEKQNTKPEESSHETSSRDIGVSFQQSRAIREAYEARLKKLDYDQKSGKLIPISEVQVEAFNAARLVRDRILNVPDKVIPLIAGKTNIFEMKEILKKELIKSLEVLSDMFNGNQSG